MDLAERSTYNFQASEIREFCLILNFLGGGSSNKCKLQIMKNKSNLTFLYTSLTRSYNSNKKVDVPVLFIYMLRKSGMQNKCLKTGFVVPTNLNF